MNILLVGNGAREHAIAKALKKSKHDVKLYVFANAKNPGIYELAEQYYIGDINDGESVAEAVAVGHCEMSGVLGHDQPNELD